LASYTIQSFVKLNSGLCQHITETFLYMTFHPILWRR
jgi:hypothetical protein